MNYYNLEEVKVQEIAKFVCSFPGCGRLFKTKFSMKRHSFVHNEDKKYVCKYCGKRFALPQYLREHAYTHTKDKPYVCGVSGCRERFRQAGKLSLHRRTHPEYQLKQYDCRVMFKDSHENCSAPAPIKREEDDHSSTLRKREIFEVQKKQSKSADAEEVPLYPQERKTVQNDVEFPQFIGSTKRIDQDKDKTEDNLAESEVNSYNAEMLKQYLNWICSPLTNVLALVMRPVLPNPDKNLSRKFSQSETHADFLNMPEWPVRFPSDQ